MRWNDWFDVAARTCLGCPSIEESGIYANTFLNSRSIEGSTNETDPVAVAVQYGGVAVLADWLDLSQRLTVVKSFSFKVASGTLGIMKDDKKAQPHFQGVEGQFAVLEVHATETILSQIERPRVKPDQAVEHPSLKQDILLPETDFVLFPVDAGRYRLVLRAVSASYSRLIDISGPMRKTVQPLATIHCKHKPPFPRLALEMNESLRFYSFAELLGQWGSVNEPKYSGAGPFTRMYHVSFLLNSYLKYNIALALSVNNVTLVNHNSTCLSCAIDRARKCGRENGIDGQECDGWIVFVKVDDNMSTTRAIANY